MMTSFAFIFGLLPLVIAKGAGADHAARRRHAGVRRHDRRGDFRHFPDSAALHHRGTDASLAQSTKLIVAQRQTAEPRRLGRDIRSNLRSACRNQLGQHFLPSGPRWYPGGQARPMAIGWQRPAGPRQNPGPHPSATLTVKLLALPIGLATMPALAAVARPKASAALKAIVRIIICSFPVVDTTF